MCQLCAEYRPWDIVCPYKTPDTHPAPDTESDPASSELPVYTYDQIADQLTTDFCGGTTYAFDLGADKTLTVDLAGLTQAGQEMARLALDAWSDVTGITFQEAASDAPTSVQTEAGDATSGAASAYSIATGEDFHGTLATAGDRDSVAITLAAGDRVTIEVTGDGTGGDAAQDLALRLLDTSGVSLLVADDPYSTNGIIAYEVSASGTYYIETSGADSSVTGDYTVSVRDVRAASDITFDDDFSGAYAQFTTQGSTITRSTINIDDNWAGGQSRIDGYYYQTYLHEIGHALGLGHAGNYNGSASYPNDADYVNDSWQASVMSYFYQTENTYVDASFAYAITPQVADVIAVQNLYGDPDTRTGDDTYGFEADSGSYLDNVDDLSNPVTYTVFDSGGTDTFDFSHYDDDQLLDLREESHSNTGGLTGNVGIARGTIIEYGKTGSGADALIGNGAANGLTSGAGADTIDGAAGNDAISSGDDVDMVLGGDGLDLIVGGAGDDLLNGGEDADVLFGDDVSLADLTVLFPGWTPPTDAADLIAEGDLLAVWESIVDDVFAMT